MAEERIQRRLAAILAADVVGYSRLVEADEAGTVARLKALQSELVHPLIDEDGGRIVKMMGDGVLVEFGSAVDAVRNALAIQTEMNRRNAEMVEQERIAFRIGVNLGDVIIDGDDIHGDGVNVAARLEGLCEPGGVYVSASVYDQVMGKLDASFDDLGEQTIKNIARPIRVYCARPGTEAATWASEAPGALPLPAKPSIAVLPFKNLSDDPSQDYLADGLRLAIQGILVQVPGLFLISPGAVGRYRDKEVAAQQVAREMGVRHVLEGAVQRSGKRLRINVQLTDAVDKQIVWAESFDRDLSDTLATQDEIAVAVVFALDLKLVSGEFHERTRSTLTNLDALNAFYRGLNHFYASSKDNNAAANREFASVYQLQPESPMGPGYLSMCHWLDASMGWTESKNQSLMQAVDWAEKCVDYELTDGMAYLVLAGFYLLNRRHDGALAACYEAFDRHPTCPISNISLANVLHYCGHSAEAVPKAKAAMRIMHVHPPWFFTTLAAAYHDIGDFDQSMATARQGSELNPKDIDSRLILCSDYGLAGFPDQAEKLAREIIEIDPTFSLSKFADTQPYKDEATQNRLIDSLRKAGLPE